MHISPRGVTDQRPHAPGQILAETRLEYTVPAGQGWLPEDAARPSSGAKQTGVLDLRQMEHEFQLSFWHCDGGLLWQDTYATREEAIDAAHRQFEIAPQQWQATPLGYELPSPSALEAEPQAGDQVFSFVRVTRITHAGDRAALVAIALFSIILTSGIFAGIAVMNRLGWNDTTQIMFMVVAGIVWLLVSLVVGFGLPYWIQRRFCGGDEFSATTTLRVGPDRLALDALGQLPWRALDSIDQVNTESGEPEAVILQSEPWGKLILRASGSSSNTELSAAVLNAILACWHSSKNTALLSEQSTVFHVLPMQWWKLEALQIFAWVLSAAMFFAILLSDGQGGPLTAFLLASFLGALTWALVAMMPLQFWSMTAARRARAVHLEGSVLCDSGDQLRLDLAHAKVRLVRRKRPGLEVEYLHFISQRRCHLQLTAFDGHWDTFVSCVKAQAGDWTSTAARPDPSADSTDRLKR